MHDPQAFTAIALLRAALPEFSGEIDELAELFEEDLGATTVFSALAERTSALTRRPDLAAEAELETIFTALETVVTDEGVDAVEAVGFGFFDALPVDALTGVLPYLHPATEHLLGRLIAGELDSWPDDTR